MNKYDLRLSDAKQRVTRVLCSNGGNPDIADIASAIDELNKAWDELTDALCRQREERDKLITSLLNQLSERPD
jgi:hypothetical protein